MQEEPNNIEPKPEPARAPEKPPEKPEPASNIAPWQRELKTRKVAIATVAIIYEYILCSC